MNKKIFFIGFITTLLIAIPVSLIAVKTTTQNTSKANPATTLAFTQATQTVNPGQSFSLDVTMNPGTNQVSFIKLIIAYDSSKVTKGDTGIVPNTSAFPTTLQGPTYDQCNGNKCTMSITLGADATKPVTSSTTIATINFKAVAATTGTPTQISFDPQTQVLSIESNQQNQNVLSTVAPPATITIGSQAQITSAISPTPTGTVAAQISPSPTLISANTANTNNVPPTCTSLVANPTSGNAPLTTDITAAGGDSDGTISKVTFNFGDGNTQDLTTGGGIGTASVSIDAAHTYQNTGTYTTTAILTDNNGGTSTTTNCSEVITVTSTSTTTNTNNNTITTTVNNTSTSDATLANNTSIDNTSTIAAQPTIPVTGPETLFLGLGALGITIAGFGAYILLAL